MYLQVSFLKKIVIIWLQSDFLIFNLHCERQYSVSS